jgi:hypothetical protein
MLHAISHGILYELRLVILRVQILEIDCLSSLDQVRYQHHEREIAPMIQTIILYHLVILCNL